MTDHGDPTVPREGESPADFAARMVALADARHAKPPHPSAADVAVQVAFATMRARTDARPVQRFGERYPLGRK